MLIFKNYKNFYLLLISYFAAVLCVGIIAQMLFAIDPCALCIIERYLMLAIIMVSFFTIKLSKKFEYLVVILLLSGSFLLLYHIGVENKIFQLPGFCVNKNLVLNGTDVLQSIYSNKLNNVRCDIVNWKIFNISATYYTFLVFFIPLLVNLLQIALCSKKK